MITLDDARESIDLMVLRDGVEPRKRGRIIAVDDAHVLVHYFDDPMLSTRATRPGDLSLVYRRGKPPMTLAVLFSHGSSMVYEELVTPERFTCRVPAETFAQRIARIQGVEYEVMELVGGRWQSRKGETPVDVIRRRWQV
ncbi:Uncharacterised protein [Mycobacteroides abscessus subsp. bolletii]|uniref:hypothetical protein n=1 Tax=Mycobacteroides abscessus TaxID=36809 RepID=UPI0009A8C512|nr:hypothetical protein [Mycobacteroides abscessus]SKX80979.1 Uncharacterised protein [Mycobacteroides abscessus subsp. bolletii]